MNIIAFNFTKIHAERKKSRGKFDVKSQIGISEIIETPIGSQKALTYKFAQEIRYSDDLGLMQLEGEVVALSNEKEVKETLESFKKNRQFAPALMESVYNHILQRTSIQSLIMARDIGLPPPVRLPSVTAKTAGGQKAPSAVPTPKAAEKEKPKKKK
jgi:hypothetical protein